MNKEKEVILENDNKFSAIQCIINILCLITPVAFAFLGFFVSPWIYAFFSKTESQPSELFKFIVSLVFFAISALIIFLKTRNTNPYIKIRVS